jgi:hypothetical protein
MSLVPKPSDSISDAAWEEFLNKGINVPVPKPVAFTPKPSKSISDEDWAEFQKNEALPKQQIVLTDDEHEEHPEAYHPRVFFTVAQTDSTGSVFYARHYELLTTGYALKWQTLPVGKFAFMHFIIKNLHQMRMVKADEKVTSYWAGSARLVSESVGPSIPSLEMK